MEMPVACSSPIRARPRTSCAFPSRRRISALNSARGMGGVYHVADASPAPTALRTDETAIPFVQPFPSNAFNSADLDAVKITGRRTALVLNPPKPNPTTTPRHE
jgi:hypothetical protein